MKNYLKKKTKPLKTVTFKTDEEMIKKLKLIAKKENSYLSEIIRFYLKEGMECSQHQPNKPSMNVRDWRKNVLSTTTIMLRCR